MLKVKYYEDPEFARYRDEPCYRTIICHALFEYFKCCNSIDDTKKAYSELFSVYDRKQTAQRLEHKSLCNFLEFFQVEMNGGTGYLMVDKSKGCFPLVFYPDSKSEYNSIPNASRAGALYPVLKDLSEKLDGIIEEFGKHDDEWNKELQNKLQARFNYKQDTQ